MNENTIENDANIPGGSETPTLTGAVDPAEPESGPPTRLTSTETPTLVRNSGLEEIEPSRPDGRCSPTGLALLTGAALVASSGVGYLYHLIASFVDLIGCLPLVMGLLAGWILSWGARLAKCRNSRAALAFTILTGVLTYGFRMYFDSAQEYPAAAIMNLTEQAKYGLSRDELRYHSAEQGVPVSVVLSRLPEGLNPLQRFGVFVAAQSEEGVFVGHGFLGDLVVGAWFWLLIGLEMGIIGFAAWCMTRRVAETAYCQQCDRWRLEHTLVQCYPHECELLEQRLRAQDWGAIRKLATAGSVSSRNRCEAVLARCSQCHEAFITLTLKRGTQEDCILHARLSPESTARLIQEREA